ncbi:hypothetical protein [uncultured Thermanaerothrix sp.]|uniref:hypothetical protein n=1 Tax=uncultured Thermanaerothrix sp. TaxID=1195149 RepID=UPI0026060192|nr:hypothetical protein [uncultured Thermanaerothrix sp.]
MAEGQKRNVHQRMLVGGMVLVLIGVVLGLKAWQEDWFSPVTPVEIPPQPVLLLFNRYRGCECALNVYKAAERQVEVWPEEARSSVPVIVINLDRHPDLGQRFKVQRAPTLILLDEAGRVIYQQNEVIQDDLPLDLKTFEQKIREMKHGRE